MRIVQNPTDSDILYVILAADRPVRTVHLDQGTVVDLDEDGRLLGVTVIEWGRPWPLEQVAEFGLDAAQVDVLRRWRR